jgi:hypothetical protein
VNARYIAKTLGGYVCKDAPGLVSVEGGTGQSDLLAWRSAPSRPFNGKRFSLAKGSTVPEVRFTVLWPEVAGSELEVVAGFRLFRVWDSPADWGKGPPISVWQG